jgi:hypothetical protein
MRPTERKAVFGSFRKKDENERTAIEWQIDAVYARMREVPITSEEYPKLVVYLERLNKIKHEGKRNPVSLDTIVTVVGSLLGIGMIIVYEQKHVMTSRAMQHLVRPK